MGRSLKKGPFADASLLKKVKEQEGSEKEDCHQDMVTSFYHFPKFYWLHICSI